MMVSRCGSAQAMGEYELPFSVKVNVSAWSLNGIGVCDINVLAVVVFAVLLN